MMIAYMNAKRLAPLIILLGAMPAALMAQANGPLPYQDTHLSTEQRVDDLVSRMTLEEKTSQMINTSAAIPRLGVPAYDWWSEGLHGVARSGYATLFPRTERTRSSPAVWASPSWRVCRETIPTTSG